MPASPVAAGHRVDSGISQLCGIARYRPGHRHRTRVADSARCPTRHNAATRWRHPSLDSRATTHARCRVLRWAIARVTATGQRRADGTERRVGGPDHGDVISLRRARRRRDHVPHVRRHLTRPHAIV